MSAFSSSVRKKTNLTSGWQLDFNADSRTEDLTWSQVIPFLFWHLPLLLLFQAVPLAATAHSVLVFLVGVHFLLRENQPRRVLWVIAYISGAEILWRGVEASLVWEYGKYATLLLAVLLILKYNLLRGSSFWPVLFFGLLVPGIFVMPSFDRQAISYELAGPLALSVLSLIFHHVKFSRADLQRLFVAILAPTLSMAALVVYMMLTNDIEFYARGENELITGNIGANQVSSTLSWGALAAFFYIFIYGKDARLRNLMIALSIGLVVVSMLTFSRAGLWNTLGAVLAGLFFLVRERRLFFNIVGIIILTVFISLFVLIPVLGDLTGGAILARFSDFDSTGRDRMAISDFETFLQNPILGVGVGQARYYRPYVVDQFKNNHTEYTRLLAEHGLLGVVAILVLALVTVGLFFSRQPLVWKGMSVGFAFWALLYLAHSATRTVAPSLAFALAFAQFMDDEPNGSPPPDEKPLAYPHRFRR